MTRSSWGWSAALVVALALGVAGCDDDDDGNGVTSASGGGNLTVAITASTTGGRAPLEVAFTSKVTGEGPYTYAWQFGDGTASNLANPTARYVAGGVFDVTLKVTSPSGTATSSPLRIQVESDMRVTCHMDPQEGFAPQRVGFRADVVGGAGPYTYAWNFGDGGVASTRETSHVYNGGTYAPRVTVSSGSGQASCSNTITIHDQLIAICKATPSTGAAPLSVRFAAKPWLCVNGSCWWEWDFGDGQTLAGPGADTPTHVYERGGTFTARAVVRTGGLKETCSNTVVVQ